MPRLVRSAATTLILFAGLHSANADGTKDLWVALKGANDAAALEAIKKGVDVNKADGTLGTPLQLAACFAGPEVVKALIAAKSNVNYVEPASTNTPLISALTWGNTEAAKLLIAAGANAKAATRYTNTLAAALASSRIDVVQLILDAGMNPSAAMMVGGAQFTPWIMFAERSLTPKEMVARLKDTQLPYLKNMLHITPPAWVANQTEASFAPLEDLTKLLLAKGALVDQEQPAFGSALFIAAKRGKVGIVKALIEAKAKLELRAFVSGPYASYMLTPLMIAALNGHTEVVELLAQAGAEVNAKTVQHYSTATATTTTLTTTEHYVTSTATSLAAREKHPETVAMLQKYGGKGPNE